MLNFQRNKGAEIRGGSKQRKEGNHEEREHHKVSGVKGQEKSLAKV